MMTTVWGTVREGKVELLEKLEIVDGARVLVTVLEDEDRDFWLGVSQFALDAVWNNPEDDVYAELLKK